MANESIGIGFIASAEPINGLIDEVRIYNYSMSAQEINDSARGVWMDLPETYPNATNVTGFVRLGDAVNGIELTRNGSYVAYSNDSALVGWWHFDNDTNDFSGRNNNGVMGGVNATYTTGKIRQALKFDGVDDYVAVADSSSLNTSNFTIGIWFRANNDAVSYTNTLLNRHAQTVGQGHWWVHTDLTGMQFGYSTDTDVPQAQWNIQFSKNTWYYAAFAYSNTTGNLTFYLNGQDWGANTTNMLPVTSGTLYISTYQGIPSYAFHGDMDEIKIYNRSLTAAEINTSYLAGIGQHYELSAAGIYQYNATYQESQNYSAYNVSKILSVTRGNSNITVTFNTSSGFAYGDPLAVWANITSRLGDQLATVVLLRNSTEVSRAIGNVSSNITLAAGIYNFSAYYSESQNWTNATATNSYFTVQRATPILGIRTNNSFGTASGAVLYLSFDENTTQTVRDQSGFGNDGTWTGSGNVTRNLTGRFGNALQFDGKDDSIDLGNSSSIDRFGNAITVSAWVNVNGSFGSGAYTIVRRAPANGQKGYLLTVTTDRTIQWALGNGTFQSHTSNSPISANTWHHVAGTYDGTNKKIYIDGVQDRSDSVSGSISSEQSNLFVGSTASLGQFMNGTIDEVRIYNYSMSAQEINDSARGVWNDLPETYPNATNVTGFVRLGDAVNGIELTRNGSYVAYTNDSALVGWWHFDNNTNDFSGWNNPGTMTGANATYTTGKIRQALKFDGVEDFVGIPDSSSLRNFTRMAVSFWFTTNTTDIGAGSFLINKDVNNGWYFQANNLYIGGFLNGTLGTVSADQWHHGAFTYNTTHVVVYRDGQEQSVYARTGQIPSADVPGSLTIGSRGASATSLNGSIDEVKVYNRSLSAREIQLEYQRGIGEHDELSAAGIYQYNVTYQESQNYSAYNVSKVLNIPQGNPNIALFLNGTQADVTSYVYGNPTNATAFRTSILYNNEGTLQLWRNSTSLGTGGPGNVSENVILPAGPNNYSAILINVANYTYSNVSYVMFIQKATPILGIQNNNSNGTTGMSGSVLYLSFDENTTGISYDQSGFRNDATWTGGANNVTRNLTGRFGNALTFDGTDDFAATSRYVNLSSAFSVSFWVNPSSSAGYQPPIAKWNDIATADRSWIIYTSENGDGNFRMLISSDGSSSYQGLDSSTSIPLGAWSHIAVTYDGSNVLRWYLDGVLRDTNSTTGTIYNSGAWINVAAETARGSYFKGTIDEVRIYNYSMSAAEINDSARGVFKDIPLIYHAPVNTTAFVRLGDVNNPISLERNGTPVAYTNDSQLVGWWHFDEANAVANTVANDSSGWNNQGTLVSGVNHTAGKFGNALSFDKTTLQYVNITPNTAGGFNYLKDRFSVTVWVNVKTVIGNQRIVQIGYPFAGAGGNGSILYIDSFNDAIFTVTHGTSQITANSTAGKVASDQWAYVAGTYDGDNVRLYVNGTLITNAQISNFTLNATYASISSWQTSRMNGTIDEVKIYNRTLSAGEIQNEYLRGVGQHYELSAAGIYQYNVTYQESQNYSAYNVSKILNIEKAQSVATLHLNDTNANRDYNRSEWINATGYLSTPLGFFSWETKLLNLTFNYTQTYSTNYTALGIITGANNTIYNITSNDVPGGYNFTLWFDGDQNYSASSASWIAGVYGNLWVGLINPSTTYYTYAQNISLNVTVRDFLRNDEISSLNVTMNLTSLYANKFKNVPYYSRNVSMININIGNYSGQYNITDIHAGNYSLNYTAARAFYRTGRNFTTIYVNESTLANMTSMFVNVTANVTQNQGVLVNGTIVRLGNIEINGTLDITIKNVVQDNVGLIVANSSALDSYEYLYNSTLTTAGYNVTLVDDDTVNANTWTPSLYNVIVWAEASYDNFFLQYIDNNIWSQVTGGKPLVMTYYGMIKGAVDLNLSSGWGGRFQRDVNVKVPHAVTDSYNNTNVSDVQDVTYNSLYLFDFRGTELADDGTSGRTIIGVNNTNSGRIVVYGPYRATYWTTEAKDMFLRSVYWAIYGAEQTTFPQVHNITVPYTFEDHFNESDGTAEGWNATIGSWIVQNGVYIQTANASADASTVTKLKNNSYWNDYTVSLRFNMLGGVANVTQVYFRHENSTRYYMLNISSNGEFAIYKNNRTAFNITDNSANTITISKDTWYTLNITVRENKLEAEIGGLGRINTTEIYDPIVGGTIALGTHRSSSRFDDVAIYHHDGGYKGGTYYFKREWPVGTQSPGTYRATAQFTYYNHTGNRTILASSVDFNITSNLTAQINITLNSTLLTFRNVVNVNGNVTAGGNLGVTGNFTLSVWNATHEITNFKNLSVSVTPSSLYTINDNWNDFYNRSGNYSVRANYTWVGGAAYERANFTVSFNVSADVNITLDAPKYNSSRNVTVNVTVNNPTETAITTLTIACTVNDYNSALVASSATNPDIGNRTIGVINANSVKANHTTWNVSANNAGTYSMRCNVSDQSGLLGFDVKTFDITRINATLPTLAVNRSTNYTVNDAVGIQGNITSVGGINVSGRLVIEVYNASQRIEQVYSQNVITAGVLNYLNITNLNLTFRTYKNFTGTYTLNATFNYTNETGSQVVRNITTQFNISSNTNATITSSSNRATYGTSDTAVLTTTVTSTANEAITNGNLTVYIFNSTTFTQTYRQYWNSTLLNISQGGSATQSDTIALTNFFAGTQYIFANFTFGSQNVNVTNTFTVSVIVPSTNLTVRFFIADNTSNMIYTTTSGEIPANKTNATTEWNGRWIVSFFNDSVIGLYGTGGGVSVSASNTTMEHRINVNGLIRESRIYAIVTKGTRASFQNRAELLDSGEFTTQINPSFGYPLRDKNLLSLKLKYSDIDVQGTETLKKGTYKLRIENNGTSGGKTLISITVI
ncbi:MAG: hypothetical protein HY515_03005 [Candidatus Aenigmarchaeota archaeon]|nr:hypothetical protein [Candidatus Aenigmarchaeota archaeon]